ncbi:hypothetical protein MCHUDSM44219_01332 [Mycolicibacterium chubuense]|uniref:Uncharacterized protein n=1 Tax=Mycolicibacterium chubuense TaxID=1800 RepID=A0A0J6WIH3_MYCCU|nr:hypothetical protein MCHUDSM44219_01332 [Mycolicibacterium chubuense]SPY00714.1 Uncharacterised protein [Mycolicibacterium chubuense]
MGSVSVDVRTVTVLRGGRTGGPSARCISPTRVLRTSDPTALTRPARRGGAGTETPSSTSTRVDGATSGPGGAVVRGAARSATRSRRPACSPSLSRRIERWAFPGVGSAAAERARSSSVVTEVVRSVVAVGRAGLTFVGVVCRTTRGEWRGAACVDSSASALAWRGASHRGRCFSASDRSPRRAGARDSARGPESVGALAVACPPVASGSAAAVAMPRNSAADTGAVRTLRVTTAAVRRITVTSQKK